MLWAARELPHKHHWCLQHHPALLSMQNSLNKKANLVAATPKTPAWHHIPSTASQHCGDQIFFYFFFLVGRKRQFISPTLPATFPQRSSKAAESFSFSLAFEKVTPLAFKGHWSRGDAGGDSIPAAESSRQRAPEEKTTQHTPSLC